VVSGYPVGIVGAGVMGASLAQALTGRGIDTVLHDHDPRVLATAAGRMRSESRLARLRRRTEGAPVGHLRCTGDLADLAAARVVVENISEDPAAKEAVHRRLDGLLSPEAVVAVNTSAVPISALALATTHPDRVVGAHFMNPVAVSTMVEVVRTPYLATWALDVLRDLVDRLDKQVVVVGDVAGFVVNRCLMMFVNEAAALLDDSVATPAEVDQLFRGCLGHRTGPLRTADLIGLDTVVRTLDVLAAHHGPDRFTPCPRLLRMVRGGQLGRKSGQGFFHYSEGIPA
jgi:3-hydroxyacyl-CoA dehydrogenase